MADDQTVKLLEEIRDLQKEFLANQKVALQNQQASMALQNRVVQRNKILSWPSPVCLCFWDCPT